MSSGCSELDDDGPAGELGQQQPFDDAQPVAARAGRQAARVTHVRVVAAQLIGNRARGRSAHGDDALGTAGSPASEPARHAALRRAQRTAQAVAARQVVPQELIDAAFVKHARRQVAHRHPVRKVRHGVQATTGGVGRIPTALQSLDVSRDLG